MANSIDLSTKFLPIMDEIYKREALTARLDAPTKAIDWIDAKTVKIFTYGSLGIGLVGMGNYSRVTGYPVADTIGTWETLTINQERGREYSIDRMDDEESLNQAFGRLVGEIMRTRVVPEVDAYRFATYAGWSGVTAAAPALLDKTTLLAAIDTAHQTLDDAEAPAEGRVLYVSSTMYMYLKQSITRLIGNENTVSRGVEVLDQTEIVRVPASRFYTQVTLDAGTVASTGGYTKTAGTGRNLNFMLLHPSAIINATKLAIPKIFSPDENQTKDAWKFQYRHYHDAFVYSNKVGGVYVHASTS